MNERTLIEAAAGILALATMARAGSRDIFEDASVELQRAAIGAAARGLVAPARVETVPQDAFTGAPRLLAWSCAFQAVRSFGRGTRPFLVRMVLARAPLLDVPRPVITKSDVAAFREAHGVEATGEWLLSLGHGEPGSMAWLHRETEGELDAAEALDVGPDAVTRLLADCRIRRTQEWLSPVVAALDRGEPMVDTAQRLREAADIFDGV